MVFKWPQRSQSNRSYWSVPCFKENKLTLFLTSSFQSSLKTTITFWCFVFVTLFNLQGTRCVLQRLLMISLRFPFVKNFFRKFFNFFSSSLIRQVLEVLSPSLSQATYLGYHTQFALSRTFSSFLNFFQALSAAWLGRKKRSAWTDRLCWHYLSFRPVSRQVFSAEASLTSVFGMGTGGPSP